MAGVVTSWKLASQMLEISSIPGVLVVSAQLSGIVSMMSTWFQFSNLCHTSLLILTFFLPT